MMENLRIYEKVRQCPQEALKPIQAGKLKGKSDINPIWRIKVLTDLFGPCGIGWRTIEETFWTTPGAGGEVIAWCSLKLQYRENEEWSEPVFGIGGSMMVDTQKGNLTSNDEAFKMAHTDAISVACKALGVAADVYWQNDRTKYSGNPEPAPGRPEPPPCLCSRCNNPVKPMKNKGRVYSVNEIADNSVNAYGVILCWDCMKVINSERAGDGK